jgi:hypothetical protein
MILQNHVGVMILDLSLLFGIKSKIMTEDAVNLLPSHDP